MDDDTPMECACGENGEPVLLIIDDKWMCNFCIQKLIDSLRHQLNNPLPYAGIV